MSYILMPPIVWHNIEDATILYCIFTLNGKDLIMIEIEKKLLKVKEVVQATGFCQSLVYAAIKSGELPSVALGRAIRVPVGELENWINKLTKREVTQ